MSESYLAFATINGGGSWAREATPDKAALRLGHIIASDWDTLISEIEEIRDEEQEAFDNMPEGLQNGEKGELAQEAVNNLESALSELESMDEISEPDLPPLEDAMSYLETAQD